ncbi:MAG: uracil phosphoribosyltransferase [Bdellovibrionales bacterium]
MNTLNVLDHPLTGTFLKLLRDENTSPETFRTQVKRLGHMLALQVSQDIRTEKAPCTTPLCDTQESVISESIALVPILRAGIGMADPFLDFLPNAQIHCLGVYRDETTHEPVSYYNKLPQDNAPDTAYIIDPMLATGGSALATIKTLKDWGVPKIKFAGLIGAPEGVKAVHNEHPEIDIFLAALDEKLNENAYIVPGLGDAGDRIFNS